MTFRVWLAALAALVVAACASPQPQLILTTLPNSDDPADPNNCFGNHIYRMTVVDAGGQPVASGQECVEFPGDFSAKVFRNRRGHMYVFVVNDSASGTGESPQDLHILQVDTDRGTLDEVARLQMTDGDMTARGLGWDVTYAVDEADSGALQVTITYAPSPDGTKCCAPPEKQITVRLGSVAAGGSTPAQAAPNAVVRPAPSETWCNGKGQGYEMTTFAVIDAGHTLAHLDTCRAPHEIFSAQAAVDRRGRIYMLLRTHSPSWHKTSGNASGWLSIYELLGAGHPSASDPDPYSLEWMADLLLSPAEDPRRRGQPRITSATAVAAGLR